MAARLLLTSGQAQLYTHQSASGGYLVTLDATGSAALYRGGQLVTAGQSVPSPDGWWTLTFTASGNDLRLTVNGQTVLAALDVSPLPSGTITLLSSDGLLVEWLSLWESLNKTQAQSEIIDVNAMGAQTDLTVTPGPITPTPLLDQEMPDESTIQSMSPSGDLDYVVVANTSELVTAINFGNANSSQRPYRIYLKPGTYNIASRLTISGRIKLYGTGVAVTIIDSDIPTDTVFWVNQGAQFEVYDLTFTGATGGQGGYGGMIINSGSLFISGAIFRNNYVPHGGASLANGTGTVTITNTIFRDNQSGGHAAAIRNGGGTVTVSCTAFDNNDAMYGGAILNDIPQGVVTVSNSRFYNNNSSSTNFGGAVYTLFINPTNIDGNWWPTWTWNGGYPGSQNIAPDPYLDTIEGVNANNVLLSDPITNGTCQIREVLANPPIADTLLQYYGVSISGWSASEADIILQAVGDTAIALSIQSNRPAVDAFNTVMRRPNLDTSPINISISKSGTVPYCLTTASVPTTIVCGSGVVLSKYTIVHELGHVFDNRADQSVNGVSSTSLEEYVATTNPGSDQPILDFGNPRRAVMGTFQNRYTFQVYWDRGPRGWGTGPASTYNSSGIALTPILTDMQQHAPPYSGTNNGVSVEANKETAADMFLNWVYRTMDPLFTDPQQQINGFRNISWDPWESEDLGTGFGVCNVPNGCPDTRNPGSARFEWMNSNLTSMFTVHNWNS